MANRRLVRDQLREHAMADAARQRSDIVLPPIEEMVLRHRISLLEEDLLEAMSEGVTAYARDIYNLLDEVGAPAASKSNHGIIEDVEERIRLLAEGGDDAD